MPYIENSKFVGFCENCYGDQVVRTIEVDSIMGKTELSVDCDWCLGTGGHRWELVGVRGATLAMIELVTMAEPDLEPPLAWQVEIVKKRRFEIFGEFSEAVAYLENEMGLKPGSLMSRKTYGGL